MTSEEVMASDETMTCHEKWLKQLKFCVNHARIAETPSQLGLEVHTASAPGDDAMLACLIKALA
jgi:uroporphyrinogen-III synthase